MHCISIPVAFLYHDTSRPLLSQMKVLVKKYNQEKEFWFNVVPLDIFNPDLMRPQDEITIDVRPGKSPYVIDFEFTAPDAYLTCVLFHPRLDVRFSNTNYDEQSIDDVPIRTINLKHNGVEVAADIPGLDQRFNFKSWVNPHLKSGDHLKFRLYADLRHAHSLQKSKVS